MKEAKLYIDDRIDYKKQILTWQVVREAMNFFTQGVLFVSVQPQIKIPFYGNAFSTMCTYTKGGPTIEEVAEQTQLVSGCIFPGKLENGVSIEIHFFKENSDEPLARVMAEFDQNGDRSELSWSISNLTPSLGSPITILPWPAPIAALFESKRLLMERLWDIYDNDVILAGKGGYEGKQLLELSGITPAIYKQINDILTKNKLPDLSRAPDMVRRNDAVKRATAHRKIEAAA